MKNDKITLSPDEIETLQDSVLDDSTKVIRYLEEEKHEQQRERHINRVLAVLAVVFSAIAAIGSIVIPFIVQSNK